MEKETESFYDDFFDRRMLNYAINGNRRIESAAVFARRNLFGVQTALDFGCGIGYFASLVNRSNAAVRVHGVDAGSKNILFAKHFYGTPDLSFRQFDSLQLEAIREELSKCVGCPSVDAIFLIDVLEHIPRNERLPLVKSLPKLLARETEKQGGIVITCPSPLYQEFLRRENPSELQLVDEIVEPSEVRDILEKEGMILGAFQYEELGYRNQYFQLFFTFPEQLSLQSASVQPKKNLFYRFFRKVVRILRRRKVLQLARRL